MRKLEWYRQGFGGGGRDGDDGEKERNVLVQAKSVDVYTEYQGSA